MARPITVQGRFIAAGLMLTGIALLGIVTASFVWWLIDKVREVEEHTRAAICADMAAPTAMVCVLPPGNSTNATTQMWGSGAVPR